jgi:PAS domain S-box-containing protein
MKNETKKTTEAKLIRQKAEALLKEKHSEKSVALTEIETIKLLRELEVQQIELEIQKKELQLAKENAETCSEKYTSLYDFAPFAYFTLNSNGEICELNFNAAKMLKKERSKLINSNFKFFIASETRSLFIDFLDKVSNTKTKQDCEVRLVINEKPSTFIHIEGILLENEKNYLLTVIDISKRKHIQIEQIKATEKAVISENYLDNIINNIGDPFFVKDEQSRILLVNDAFCELFNLTKDNIIGKTLAEDISPEEMEGFLKIDKQVLKTGQENIIEETLTVRGGRTKTISTRKTRYIGHNDKKYLICIIRDLTKRKMAEVQLKETLSQNQLAVDMSKLGVWQLNVDSGELLWNDRHLEFYGITRKEFTNNLEGWSSQLHPDDKNYAESRFNEVFQNKSIHDLNFRIIRPNGEIRYLNASGVPIFIDGKLVKVIGVNRDITEAKISEKQLQESEANINAILNSLPASVCVIDDTGKILQVNDTWKKFANSNETIKDIDYYSKYNYFDVCRQDVQDDDSKIILEGLLSLIEKKTTEFEYEYPCHSPGRKQWFYMRADLMKSREKQVVISHTDITYRKLAEENRKETLARLNLAVDTAKLGVWQLNVDSGELLWNDRHLEFYGITREEFNNDTEAWRHQIHPDDKKYVDSRLQELLLGKPINDVNFRIINPKGNVRYLTGSAAPIVIDSELVKVIGVNKDITEIKNSDKELKESEGRIRLFTQNVPDFLLQIDRAGKINYINKTLEGLTQKDVIGSSIYSWISDEFLEQFKDKVRKIFRDGNSEVIEHLDNNLKGEHIWFESKIGPLEKSGTITQVIIVSRDITERKKAELILKRALSENLELKQQIEAENIYLKEELKLEGSFNEIVGSSKSLRKVLKQVEQVAHTDSTVLILGETGTGKELIARAIHNASDRKDKPMVKVNCSALPVNLIESELFGHEKGAFTGALNRKIGRFELATGGTIFLDEIGDLPIELQTRLLRVLQESEFERLGGEKTIKVDVRVITATNRNLAQQVLENKFRQDLYYRLNVFPIKCPPLRNRIDDIPSLVHHFVNKYNSKVSNKIKTVHQKTIERLIQYNWPGNIRELEHVIERAIIVNKGEQLRLGNWFMDNRIDTKLSDDLSTLETVERDYIIKVLETTNWKIRGKNGAAEILGMQPTTLESRMKKRAIKR